jgi:hypothetical protein
MTDKEIFDVTDKALERYTKAVSELIASELNSVRQEIKGVKEQFAAMNGRLGEVCKWKTEQEVKERLVKEQGGEKGVRFTRRLQTLGILVAFISVFSGMYFGFSNINRKVESIQKETEFQSARELERHGYDTPVVRGDTLHF